MNGISLHIGLNAVDPTHYSNWSGILSACEFDAGKMKAIAEANSYTSQALLTVNATRKKITDAITDASNKLVKGDIFLLTYSGHGSQVPDQNGEESDFLDETWCLYDGQLIDDELYHLWSHFQEGVRILVLSDSCHSGSVIKAMQSFAGGCDISDTPRNTPDSVALNTYLSNKAFYDGLLGGISSKSKAVIKASVRLISGCQDNQLSYENAFGGYFTNAVVSIWNGGKFKGDYDKFHKRIVSLLPEYQSPNHITVGRRMPSYTNSKPFKI